MQESDPLARLERARAQTETRLRELTEARDEIVAASESANLDDEHDPEGSTVGFERAQVQALLDATRTRLAEVDAARERVERGTYGICEACGRSISPPRLDAQPTARTCVECADPVPGERRPA